MDKMLHWINTKYKRIGKHILPINSHECDLCDYVASYFRIDRRFRYYCENHAKRFSKKSGYRLE